MKRIRKKFVASVPMFQGQSDEFVGVLATYLRKRTFRAGEFVFYKGEIGDSMYFIKSGSADVLLELGADPVATRGKNEFVGEQALLEEAPRNAHIRASAEGKLTCYELSKAALMRVIAWFPQARSIISKPSSVRRTEMAEAYAFRKRMAKLMDGTAVCTPEEMEAFEAEKAEHGSVSTAWADARSPGFTAHRPVDAQVVALLDWKRERAEEQLDFPSSPGRGELPLRAGTAPQLTAARPNTPLSWNAVELNASDGMQRRWSEARRTERRAQPPPPDPPCRGLRAVHVPAFRPLSPILGFRYHHRRRYYLLSPAPTSCRDSARRSLSAQGGAAPSRSSNPPWTATTTQHRASDYAPLPAPATTLQSPAPRPRRLTCDVA